jgi:DNA repair protein RecN (Recombination protein N)
MLGGDEKERGRRLDILRFQIDEIQAVDLKEGEEEELLAKRNKIINLEKIISAVQGAVAAISEDRGVLDGLRMASRSLPAISRLDDSYSAVCDRLENLAIDAEDVAETLNDLGDELYFDENEGSLVTVVTVPM